MKVLMSHDLSESVVNAAEMVPDAVDLDIGVQDIWKVSMNCNRNSKTQVNQMLSYKCVRKKEEFL